jgi:hypothetical protein
VWRNNAAIVVLLPQKLQGAIRIPAPTVPVIRIGQP